MTLPKINYVVYECILPSTQEVIKYRPYQVKDEKLLLTANQENDVTISANAIRQVVENCIVSDIDTTKLELFDIEYMFLKLRIKSVSETTDLNIFPTNCKKNDGKLCNNAMKLTLDLEKINMVYDETHTKKIMLTDTIGVMMKYPTIEMLSGMATEDNVSVGISVIISCIDVVFEGDELFEKDAYTNLELIEFVDNLDSKMFKKIEQFFDTIPALKHEVKQKCELCKETKTFTFEGLNSFFA